MDTLLLAYFRTVARAGNLTAAARQLGLTQPGLTKAMRRLEDELGCRLLKRLPRGVALTAEGEALSRHAGLIEAQLADAAEEIAALAKGRVGLLRIGAGPSWLTRVLPRAIQVLAMTAPGVRVRVIGSFSSALVDAVAQGDLDVVVAALPDEPPRGLATIPLTRDRLQVVARAGHPLVRRGGTIAPVELLRYPWALPEAHVLSRIRLEALFRVSGLDPPIPIVETDSLPFITAVLRESDMLSFATSRLLGDDMAGLSALTCPAMTVTRTAGIITRRAAASSPLVKRFVDAVTAAAAAIGEN